MSGIPDQKRQLTPDSGFNLVATDYITSPAGELYLVAHYDAYRDALDAIKSRENPQGYYILYRGPGGEYLCR